MHPEGVKRKNSKKIAVTIILLDSESLIALCFLA